MAYHDKDNYSDRKRARPNNNNITDEQKSLQADIAAHYNSIQNVNARQRAQSPIIGLKNYNNWVKSVLISEFIPENAAVLDLCCGKGGDLIKFIKNKIGYYIAADHAGESLKDAIDRLNKMSHTFPAIFIEADCHQHILSKVLTQRMWFDAVSCQFALHYSFESATRARKFVQNMSERLLPGGHVVATFPDANAILKRLRGARSGQFGNKIFTVKFDPDDADPFIATNPFGIKYTYNLTDAISDCPEYLVHLPTLQRLAAMHGLDLVYSSGFHKFLVENRDKLQSNALVNFHSSDHDRKRMKDSTEHKDNSHKDSLRNGLKVTPEDWEALSIYVAVVFRKRTPQELDPALKPPLYTVPPDNRIAGSPESLAITQDSANKVLQRQGGIENYRIRYDDILVAATYM